MKLNKKIYKWRESKREGKDTKGKGQGRKGQENIVIKKRTQIKK